MAKSTSRSRQRAFRSMDSYLRHYYPEPEPTPGGDRDIRLVAQNLAACTVESVRRQLAKH